MAVFNDSATKMNPNAMIWNSHSVAEICIKNPIMAIIMAIETWEMILCSEVIKIQKPLAAYLIDFIRFRKKLLSLFIFKALLRQLHNLVHQQFQELVQYK